jgi:hypothetical protein
MSYSSANPGSWGGVRLEGDDDLSLGNMLKGGGGSAGGQTQSLSRSGSPTNVRSLGQGIEGRPVAAVTNKAMRRTSGMSWSSPPPAREASSSSAANGRRTASGASALSPGGQDPPSEDDELEIQKQRRESQLLTTLALLQTFHAHILFQLSTLERYLPSSHRPGVGGSGSGNALSRSQTLPALSSSTRRNSPSRTLALDDPNAAKEVVTITISAKDLTEFELGPFSSLDAKYLEWLGDEYGGGGVRLVVRRGWKDLVGVLFGY